MLKVRHIVKVESVGSVEMTGTLGYYSPDDPDELGYWEVSYGNGKSAALDEWLEKFKGRYITLSITAHEHNEAGLIEDAE